MATRQLPIIGGHQQGFTATTRTDSWWLGPMITLGRFLRVPRVHYVGGPPRRALLCCSLFEPFLFARAVHSAWRRWWSAFGSRVDWDVAGLDPRDDPGKSSAPNIGVSGVVPLHLLLLP